MYKIFIITCLCFSTVVPTTDIHDCSCDLKNLINTINELKLEIKKIKKNVFI